MKPKTNKPSFVDVFAGCGGLSLGLLTAGWAGRFAVEKNEDAFLTLSGNLAGQGRRKKSKFVWPGWLPVAALSTGELLANYGDQLRAMRGDVTLLAGGPPCQGFSLAGRRTHSDPRNALIEDYLDIVKILQPRMLLVENVTGFTFSFSKGVKKKGDRVPYSERIKLKLEAMGYVVFADLVDLSRYGVPQTRKRFILIAIQKGDKALVKLGDGTPFDLLDSYRADFLASKNLSNRKPVSVKDAIGDLESANNSLVECNDSPFKSYVQVDYESSSYRSPYIKLMRKDGRKSTNSLRLVRHRPKTVEQFREIMDTCEAGKSITSEDRERLGIKKHALTPLAETAPSATVTTLPDDMIHYSEARILTARESARLQSFPDSFRFSGSYTTGGAARKTSCPRYTQIGNAVPPLFAEAIGRVLKKLAR